MAKKKAKFYVVWEGREMGVFNSWDECKPHIESFQGAKYKSFATLAEANAAFIQGASSYIVTKVKTKKKGLPKEVLLKSICVDAACSGNPGVMEYQAVETGSKKQLFHVKQDIGTNNIGEFLAIVHALAYLKQQKAEHVIYSDSKIAIAWVNKKEMKTLLPRNDQTATLWDLIDRAVLWLQSNVYNTKILKWKTDEWGENPADFGRK